MIYLTGRPSGSSDPPDHQDSHEGLVPGSLVSDLLALFESKDQAREEALSLSRQIIRHCSASIRSIHRGESSAAQSRLHEAKETLLQMQAVLLTHPDIRYSGFVDGAEQEYAEALAVFSLIHERSLPTPEVACVQPANYLAGLGDASGELRRHVLDLIRQGRPQEAEPFLVQMEEIFSLLMLFDFPDALVRGLRRKSDLSRSMLERTRGDLANAIGRASLEQRMLCLEDKIKGVGP
ncbi:MAG: Translin family protein [Methanosaeta sp. PtaB.Bin039]|nr:MAG: Translin family protein [Methanosaeta sp. PtaB.Bin039]OPY46781.1 MAG: Translin family protein [Methanosaeta sp. PtaU1.Bin028]